MKTETVFDLRYNIAAMYIAILREDIATPEQAFAVVSNTSVIKATTDEDVKDMIAMRSQGLTYKQIAEIYGSTGSNIYHRIEYKKKTYQPPTEKVTNKKTITTIIPH